MSLKNQLLVGGVLVFGVLAGIAGFVQGSKYGVKVASAETAASDEREQKMLAFIVKRNPQATIRDYAALPAHILRVAREHGIDYRLIMAVIDKESEFHHDRIGTSGEIGLMQIMPSTAAQIAKRLNDASYRAPVGGPRNYTSLGTLGDPKRNIDYGVQYLAWQVQEFGMGPVALRAYNRNPDNAKQHRPEDRYAEEVSFRFVALAGRLK